ncbi:hypothetical protein ACTHGU_06220 [Chitinophagaceae bacterium MMS25-I14]
MNKTNIRHWQSTHNDWLRALDFYNDEINILKGRLNEIAAKNTGKNVMAQVEHFENQFTLHRENIDELQHNISADVAKVRKDIESNNGFAGTNLLDSLEQKEEKYITEEKLFMELKQSFKRFCSEWM